MRSLGHVRRQKGFIQCVGHLGMGPNHFPVLLFTLVGSTAPTAPTSRALKFTASISSLKLNGALYTRIPQLGRTPLFLVGVLEGFFWDPDPPGDPLGDREPDFPSRFFFLSLSLRFLFFFFLWSSALASAEF